MTEWASLLYGLQVLMAFEDGGVWQRTLYCLANGEASLESPSCDEYRPAVAARLPYLFGDATCPREATFQVAQAFA